MGSSTRILSRERIEELISNGEAIIIYKDYVLNLTRWLPKHPGGVKAVYHMIGRDATDEMNAYHSAEAMEQFKRWKIGKIDYFWENLLPPIQGGVYRSIKYSRSESLDEKLDESSSTNKSDIDLLSSSSSDDMSEWEYKGLGYLGDKVTSKVPQNKIITESNKDLIFPIRDSNIVDPKLIVENYDNQLSREAILTYPSLDYDTQTSLREKYDILHETIIKNGLYKCNYWNYVQELVKITSLFIYSFSFLKLNYLFLSALCMGIAWHQMTFIAHDSGHVSLTHNYQIDNIFGIIIADWFGGLSLGWWKTNHNVHHLITNDPVHDPDIQHLPFFAVSVKLFQNVYSTYYDKFLYFDAFAKKLIPIQNYMYYPILCFGRFNLYRLSWVHLLYGLGPKKGQAAWHRYFELAGLSFFFWWFFYLLVHKSIEGNWNKFMFVMVSHISTMLVHVQITLSHFAMSTSDLGTSESFPLRQIRTTMDVDCPEWLDFLHGGLQFQAIHHLFPRLPRHNLRKAQPFVIDFCKEVGLPYSIYGFGRGNELIIGKLGDVAKQCSIMMEATKCLKDHDH